MTKNFTILTMLLISTVFIFSCSNETKSYKGQKYMYGISKGLLDSFDITMEVQSGKNYYHFRVINHELQDSNDYSFNTHDKSTLSESKSFSVDNKEIEITRYQFENLKPITGRAYIFIDPDNKPIVVAWRDWGSYFSYIFDEDDLETSRIIASDTTCFFRCGTTTEAVH